MTTFAQKTTSHLKKYKPYYITYAAFVVCLFGAAEIYSHLHFEAVPLAEMYQADKDRWEKTHLSEQCFMNYNDWIQEQDQKSADFYREFGNQCASTFDPWFEPQQQDFYDRNQE